MNNEIIVKSIKDLCKKHGITANQLESKVGLSQGLISRWLKTTPSLDKIIDIADYFNESIDNVIGRVLTSPEDDQDIILALMQMTDNKEIQWKEILDWEDRKVKNRPYEELFSLYIGDEKELYRSKYNNSYIFLVVQYDLEQGAIENLDIDLYLQPDNDSLPVVQDYDDKWIQEFWVGVRKPFHGVPDEWKAESVKKQIITNSEQSFINNYSAYLEDMPQNDLKIDELLHDENAKKVLTEVNSPEVQQLITLFTNPKMTQAMNSAQKLIDYFNEIKNEKKNRTEE